MATNAPFGFSPRRYLNGAPYSGAGNIYYIASDDANAFAIGDPVKSSGTADANGIAGVTLGTAGAAIRGIILAIGNSPALNGGTGNGMGPGGPYINPANLSVTVAPATKTSAYYALIMDDPNVLCAIQEVNSGTAFTATEVGLNADFVAGTNNGYVSGFTLNNSGEATTSTLNCKIMGLDQEPGNGYMGNSPAPTLVTRWLVMLNNHELRAGITGV